MKLLFYTPVDLRAGLGCERWHCDITNSLKNQFNDEIRIVSGNLGIKRWSTTYLYGQLLGTHYQRLNFINFFSSIIPDPINFIILLKHFYWADSIHFIYGFIGQDILIALLKLVSGKKILVGYHAPLIHFSRFHNLYIKYFSRYLLNYFDAHMTLNSTDKHTLDSWGIQNVHFIPSGIRVEKFMKLTRKNHAKLNFLSVGRYDTPQKGFDLLIEGIRKFNLEHPKNLALFHFVGSGQSKSIIEQATTEIFNILNHGYVDYEKITVIYEKCDVYLLSSREEPFGLILIEAWASGMPILATQTEGPRDMLIENKNGWLIKETTAQSINDAITTVYQKWMKSKKFLLLMEPACRRTGKKYNIDITAQKLRSLFDIN